MGYEVRIIVRLLKILLKPGKFSRNSLLVLINAIETNFHMMDTAEVERRLEEMVIVKRTPPMSFAARKERREKKRVLAAESVAGS